MDVDITIRADRRTTHSVHVAHLVENTQIGDARWRIHPDGGWSGIYDGFRERLTSDGYFYGYKGQDIVYHVPTSACPDDFADLYAAIIASYDG
jgi:hypothetical protein